MTDIIIFLLDQIYFGNPLTYFYISIVRLKKQDRSYTDYTSVFVAHPYCDTKHAIIFTLLPYFIKNSFQFRFKCFYKLFKSSKMNTSSRNT